MEEKSRNILISEDKIQSRIKALGADIEQYYKTKMYVLSLLRGSFIFTADLVRAIDIPVKLVYDYSATVTVKKALEMLR